MEIFKFACGDTVKDTITKFKGIVIGRTQWLNGCIRYQIQPLELKDGVPVEHTSIDEQQLKLEKRGKQPERHVFTMDEKEDLTGGPRKDPKDSAPKMR